MTLREEQAVLIHWNDSISGGGWKDRDYAEDFDMQIQTIGWLIQDLPDSYVVSAHVSNVCGDPHSPMKIPKSAVTGFWEIEL